MTKKIHEKHSSPYDLGSKGGFKKHHVSVSNCKHKTPYDLNQAGRNTNGNGLRDLMKPS